MDSPSFLKFTFHSCCSHTPMLTKGTSLGVNGWFHFLSSEGRDGRVSLHSQFITCWHDSCSLWEQSSAKWLGRMVPQIPHLVQAFSKVPPRLGFVMLWKRRVTAPHFVPQTSSWKLHFASPSSITIWNILLLRDSSPSWTHQFENPTQRGKCFF